MNYSFIISSSNQLKKIHLISLNAPIYLTNIELYLTLGWSILLVFILINDLIDMIPCDFASTSHFLFAFPLGFTVMLGLNKYGFIFFSLFALAGCSLSFILSEVRCLFIFFMGLLIWHLIKILFTYISRSYINIKWGYPPKPHLLASSPLQSNIFFGNLLNNLTIKFRDPKFWMNWTCTMLTVVFTRYLYINSGLDIGWLLECFSLSSIGFFTRQIFSVLFETIRLPVGTPSTLYMDNPGNPSSSNVADSIDSGNQQVKVTNPLTKEELKEISGKLSKNTAKITDTCRSIDSKIENLKEGYSKIKHNSLLRSLQVLQDTQVERNTLFGDVYARNGDASLLQQTQYPASVHNTIRRGQSALDEYNHQIRKKAWEAQLAEHGFEATGAVSSSLTSSKK